MNIIYCHHAQRNRGATPSQDDDITYLGEQDAKIFAEMLKVEQDVKVSKIYTSPFFRCKKTADIINEHINVPIVEDDRLNEFYKPTKNETWIDVHKRIRSILYEIVCNHDENDSVICVTSGTILACFASLAYKLEPTNDTPFIAPPSCAPILFQITKDNFNQ